jgi:hypothetical protein
MLLSFLKRRGDKQTFLCCCRMVVLYRHLQAYVNLAKKKEKLPWSTKDGLYYIKERPKRTFYLNKIAGINHEYTENKEKLRGK